MTLHRRAGTASELSKGTAALGKSWKLLIQGGSIFHSL